MAIEKTSYGLVDAAALTQLRDSFDTQLILSAVDQLDEIRSRIDLARDELLQIHTVAHDLINDAGRIGDIPDNPVWDLADELSVEFSRWADSLEAMRDPLEQLAKLMPDMDDPDYDDDATN